MDFVSAHKQINKKKIFELTYKLNIPVDITVEIQVTKLLT